MSPANFSLTHRLDFLLDLTFHNKIELVLHLVI